MNKYNLTLRKSKCELVFYTVNDSFQNLFKSNWIFAFFSRNKFISKQLRKLIIDKFVYTVYK